MAKKNQQNVPSSPGQSNPEGFTQGMVSDLDPRFQLKGSYADAQNIRLTNSEGDTFTVENIEGNSLFVDLADHPIHQANNMNNSAYPTFRDRGPNHDLYQNRTIENRCSIVGSISFRNELILVIVGRFDYIRNHPDFGGTVPLTNNLDLAVSGDANYTSDNTQIDRTIFLRVEFDSNFRVSKITDLLVCYTASEYQYPDLNMDIDNPIRMEYIIENENIQRIYWTDNKNPLRTLNLKADNLWDLEVEALNITPLMKPSQVVLDQTLHGNLPVGVYQYTYKYISQDGGESTFAPLSNMYHVTDGSFSNSNSYQGGPKGNLGSQGFQVQVNGIDDNFEFIELYSLYYDTLNQPPRVAVVARNEISGTNATFQHVVWNNEVERGLEEILIESNTFDVCKDIAIKDNILFAANLRQKRNFISEKEWNVKILRWRTEAGDSSYLDAMLTCNDTSVKHYTTTGTYPNHTPQEITDFTQDYNNDYVGHGQLLGAAGSMYDATGITDPADWRSHWQYNGTLNNPMWTTPISNLRHGFGGTDNRYFDKIQYRYLQDRMTLGGESFEYARNLLGGCRVTFGLEQRVADQTQNAYSSPYISASNDGKEITTNYSGNNSTTEGATFKTSMSLGGSKDPHAAGDKRGYQRGDVYRFGVQIYDLNGAPGNVLWIGDIETPHQHDILRQIDIENNNAYNVAGYTPYRPTIIGEYTNLGKPDHYLSTGGGFPGYSLVGAKNFKTLPFVKDHRLSAVYGHTVPPPDVEWFTNRNGTSPTPPDFTTRGPYVLENGDCMAAKLTAGPNGTNGNYTFPPNAGDEKINKALPYWNNTQGGLGSTSFSYLENHTDTHYLYDLYVNFEFMIPYPVLKKISGFRVVRAERKEEDRRIVQQGLLNQTAQYGCAQHGLKYGYGKARFSNKDNEAFDDDPVFVNDWNDQNPQGNPSNAIEPTKPEQPEYNVYLNGYLGLAENSHYCFYDNDDAAFDSGSPDGKATTGGNSEGKVFHWPEREDRKVYGSQSAERVRTAPDSSSNVNNGGPGSYGRHFRHCAYFGSYDKAHQRSNSDPTRESVYPGNSDQIDNSIFTLDAPDSAFGIRPYTYRPGDMIRIDCLLKLTDETRYDNQTGYGWNDNGPHHFWSNCNGQSKRHKADSSVASRNWGEGGGHSNKSKWEPEHTDTGYYEGLQFTTKKEIDKDYCVLIGKYYCYEPYFGVGMEMTGGNFAGLNNSGNSSGQQDYYWKPNKNYGWQLPVANAKEITDGEIVPTGFFSVSRRMKGGLVNGFSNNTLGFVRKAVMHKESDNTTDVPYHEKLSYYVYDAVHHSIPFIQGSAAGSTQNPDVKEEDYTYDTVSTMQMGLRTILLEVNTNMEEVRRYQAPGTTTASGNIPTYFAYGHSSYIGYQYNSWFAPLNLSAIYEHGSWLPYNSDTNAYQSAHSPGPLNQGYNSGSSILHPIGVYDLGTENHDGGHYNRFSSKNKSLVPFKYLCSIVRYTTPYGGYTKGAIQKTRWMPCSNFHRVQADNDPAFVNYENGSVQAHVAKTFGGDTFVNLYSHQKTSSPYMRKSASRFQVFPVESFVNTDMRSGLTLNAGDTVVGKDMNQPPFSNDWLYNSVYSQENNIKSGLTVDEDTFDDSLNLPYEIAYSNTKILGQSSDAFRQFPINQFHDMEGQYGEINRIINFKNELYVLQDSAFAKLAVNPVSVLTDDSGASLFTGTGDTIEYHTYISSKFGSRHRFSVTTSDKSLYFVDTNFARLFKYDTEKLISLGDALGQRAYLKYIMHDWKKITYRECPSLTGGGGGVQHAGGPVVHGTLYGDLKSVEKPDGSRNYFADNPLRFLGITSIFDYNTKELMVTFHNSSFANKNRLRQEFARPYDNHTMGSTTNGQPVGISETLVYSEAVNAFTSKYTVAPPQWIPGGLGTFIVCPQNEIGVNAIANFNSESGLRSFYSQLPYNVNGSYDDGGYKQYRTDPLKLWMWGRHNENKKTHFFGKKDDVLHRIKVTSPITGTEHNAMVKAVEGVQDMPDESYIVKVINSEASSSKIFDNTKVVMTPEYVNYSHIEYTTDLSHDTIDVQSLPDQFGLVHPKKLDETEELTINKRWDFKEDSGHLGWYATVYTNNQHEVQTDVIDNNVFTFADDTINIFSPRDKDGYGNFELVGKYNNKIRMRLKRTTAPATAKTWLGNLFYQGYDPIKKENGQYQRFGMSFSRTVTVDDPGSTIEDDFVVLEWDMAGNQGTDGSQNFGAWDESIIEQIQIRLEEDSGTSVYEIDYIEIGGLKAHKYSDGTLKAPLRTEKSIRRTRGTYSKIKYRAKTTEKFNIFAILAKYRKTY